MLRWLFLIGVFLYCAAGFKAYADIYSAKCKFDKASSAQFDADKQEFLIEFLKNENFTMEFAFEDKNATGTMIGSLGAARVQVVWGTGTVTFLETTDIGVVQVTVLYGKALGMLPATHSRHSNIVFPLPSQYYGKCEVK